MRTSPPTRIPTDVYEAAVAEGRRQSRTTPQQIAYWARLGRELESSPLLDHRAVSAVLDGGARYDDLGSREQALVRAARTERVKATRESLDFAAEFRAAGESWSEADSEGRSITRNA